MAKRVDRIFFAAVALASSLWCLSSSARLGATFDEPPHIEGGLDYWHTGRFTRLLLDGAMPLAQHLQTLPVFIAERTSGRRFTIENDLGEMLRLSRPVTLIFWIILLAAVMRLARLLGGPWAGRMALATVAAEPSFLAHASLATTDLALAACFTAFVGQFLATRGDSGLRRVLLPAIIFGFTITAKVSALALFPFAVAAVWLHAPHDRTAVRRLLVDAIWILAVGMAFNVLYCGTGGQTFLTTTLSGMAADDWRRPIIAWVGSLPVFPNALYAIWFQLSHNVVGQPVFIAGRASTDPIWYFLPLLLLIKLTLPVLAALGLAIAVQRSTFRTAIIAAGFLAAAVAVFRVQTGIRFVLPLLVLAIAWGAAQLAALWSRPNRGWRLTIVAIGMWMAIESAVTWPDGIRYVNELWGGPSGGYRVVSDSNYDWGQGLPGLARWQRERGVEVAVWYFGTDTRYPEIVRYNPRIDPDDRKLDGRVLAVSASLLYGGYLETPDRGRALIERLRAATPIGRTSTFFIFDQRP